MLGGILLALSANDIARAIRDRNDAINVIGILLPPARFGQRVAEPARGRGVDAQDARVVRVEFTAIWIDRKAKLLV